MTRAVITLSNDISGMMPRLSGRIPGCAYNPEAHLMAFPFAKMSVTIEANKINLYHIDNETIIKTFMDWFENSINGLEP